MVATAKQRVQKAHDLAGVSRAFRPTPLRAEEMEFYSDALNKCRSNPRRSIRKDLLEAADQGFFFKGVLYGNRGCGKSTEINNLLEDPAIKQKFVVVKVDATEELNPQTFSVVDFLSLLAINLIEQCRSVCSRNGNGFQSSWSMIDDLPNQLKSFFPELQGKFSETMSKEGTGELNTGMFKASIRVGGQIKEDRSNERRPLSDLGDLLKKLIKVAFDHVPGWEILVVGENFDKEQIPHHLLSDAFVQYSAILRDLPVHLLFTLPVPFVYSNGNQLPFERANRYPLYDAPVFDESHRKDIGGLSALTELMRLRADLDNIIEGEALQLLQRASGGDLYLLFALTIKAGRLAGYRNEDHPSTPRKILSADAVTVVREQLSIFRNEMGTTNLEVETDWPTKKAKLRKIYEDDPEAAVPDPALYQLLRRRAVLFCNGKGRYAAHPLAVEMLRENFANDPSFTYKGGGLDLPS